MVFSSLHRREKHFSYAQDHKRAAALTVSINIIHNTFFTVFEVEDQQTVNIKQNTLKTDHVVFGTNERENSSQLSGNVDWRIQISNKIKCIAVLKLTNRESKMLWLRSRGILKNRPE